MAIARPFTTGSRGSATGCSAFCSITEWLQRTGGVKLGSTPHFAVAAQHVGKGRRCKAAMAYFDNVPYRAAVQLLRQQFEKGGKAGLVESHARGKLPQDRPELWAQFEDAGSKEAVDRRAGRRQIGAVRDKARALQREDEVLRSFVVPAAKARRLLRAVEGAVDLDRGNSAASMGELARLRQAGRIKHAAPWRKYPAADTGSDSRCGTHHSPGSGTMRVGFRSAGSPTTAKLSPSGSSRE